MKNKQKKPSPFKTPQPERSQKKGGKKTPKSAPPADPKRKKLTEELDEELSDEEFEVLIMPRLKIFCLA